ncbi:MAG: MotA/TolQ/ExbB proton channel family protein [Actinobacteria bacterium]|nr:MotA/TolQ/ExbB proton channel family protein [Actinomycetota bacterium]
MNGLQQVIYDASRVLFWPVLIAALACLLWVLIELGFFLYELYLRFRYRDLDALEARTLRARRAFQDGKPRTAYRYLQENNYSIVVARFLFDLVRNYQTERLAAKPLKLLQEYEFYTVKRLERTRILVRAGPILGLMGTLIPLSPALIGLASGNTTQLAENLTTAFSVTVIGLLIGGIAFVISIVRDRMYSQDISDMEYLLELLEGNTERLQTGRRRNKKGIWDADPVVEYEAAVEDADKTVAIPVLLETPREPLIPFASGDAGEAPVAAEPAVTPAPAAGEAPPLTFDDPAMDWRRDEDPFADLGPVDPEPPAGGASAPGAGAPPARR